MIKSRSVGMLKWVLQIPVNGLNNPSRYSSPSYLDALDSCEKIMNDTDVFKDIIKKSRVVGHELIERKYSIHAVHKGFCAVDSLGNGWYFEDDTEYTVWQAFQDRQALKAGEND